MDLLEKRMSLFNNNMGYKLKTNSDLLMERNFTHDVNYKVAKLYDWNSKYLEDVELKFQFSQKYSINKDQVEYLIQFKPNFFPEEKYIREDGQKQLGFFLEIPDAGGIMRKWLIVGRNQTPQFIRYNVLECNWVFKFIVNDVLYEQLGVIRDRNNYNSGVWSDGFVTSVENQACFIVPSNHKTFLIDYDMRFMLSDNHINPLVYKVTKRTDTFPIGVQKIILSQDHYNEHTDNTDLKVCDYYHATNIQTEESKISKIQLTYNGKRPNLVVGGNARTITAIIYDFLDQEIILDKYNWNFKLNNTTKTLEELSSDFIIEINKNAVSIKAKRNYQLLGQVLELELVYKQKTTSIKMEVVAK